MNSFNRRKYPRATLACHITFWPNANDRQVIMATTINIGVGGACVILNQMILPETRVEVKVDFIHPSVPFKCPGIVTRCEEKGFGRFEMGVQFDSLDEIKRAFLEGKIAELIDKEKHGE